MTWLGKGIECVSDQNSLDESRSFKDNYLRYFDPIPARQRKGLQLIFKNSTALYLTKIIYHLILIARVMEFVIQNSIKWKLS